MNSEKLIVEPILCMCLLVGLCSAIKTPCPPTGALFYSHFKSRFDLTHSGVNTQTNEHDNKSIIPLNQTETCPSRGPVDIYLIFFHIMRTDMSAKIHILGYSRKYHIFFSNSHHLFKTIFFFTKMSHNRANTDSISHSHS